MLADKPPTTDTSVGRPTEDLVSRAEVGRPRHSSPTSASSARVWQSATVRLAVALAFADASIVVLALPEIVSRLHTSISHVTWVIMAYNLALIAAAAAVIPLARRLDATRALISGLALFGLASIGCGVADSMSALVPSAACRAPAAVSFCNARTR